MQTLVPSPASKHVARLLVAGAVLVSCLIARPGAQQVTFTNTIDLVTVNVAQSQTQAPPLRAGVTVVPLDVRVVDRQGRPVTDLTRDDFIVSEDGVRQAIAHFERQALTSGRPGPAPARSSTASSSVDGQGRRVFYIELGRLWLGNPQFGLVEALTTFLRERLLPQDYALVSVLGRITDLTTDHEALAQVVERVAALHDAIGRRSVLRDALYDWRGLAADSPIRRALDQAFAPASSGFRLSLTPQAEYSRLLDAVLSHYVSAQTPPPAPPSPGGSGGAAERAMRVRLDADVIRSDFLSLLGAVQYLRFIDGEKHLVYFPANTGVQFAPGAVEDDRELARGANDARVALHILSRTNGLPIGRLNLSADMAVKNITTWTGGSVFINKWPDEALAKIDEVTRGGYLLAYSPIKATADERDRKITVRVTRPDGARVMVRESYLSTDKPPTYDPVTYIAKQHMLTVAAFPGGIDDLGVAVTATSASATSLAADVMIDVARVQFTREGDRHVAKLELAILCSDNRGRLVGQRWLALDLRLRDETLAKALAEGLKHSLTVPVTSRVRSVKAVVYDYANSRAGAGVADVK